MRIKRDAIILSMTAHAHIYRQREHSRLLYVYIYTTKTIYRIAMPL